MLEGVDPGEGRVHGKLLVYAGEARLGPVGVLDAEFGGGGAVHASAGESVIQVSPDGRVWLDKNEAKLEFRLRNGELCLEVVSRTYKRETIAVM